MGFSLQLLKRAVVPAHAAAQLPMMGIPRSRQQAAQASVVAQSGYFDSLKDLFNGLVAREVECLGGKGRATLRMRVRVRVRVTGFVVTGT